jgi:hypothetical protein
MGTNRCPFFVLVKGRIHRLFRVKSFWQEIAPTSLPHEQAIAREYRSELQLHGLRRNEFAFQILDHQRKGLS